MAPMWIFPDSRQAATRRLLSAKSAPQPHIGLKLSHTTVIPRNPALAVGLCGHAFLFAK